jgi:hypothetical protein
MERFRSFVADDYRAHLMVDNLPAAYNRNLVRMEKSGKVRAGRRPPRLFMMGDPTF